MRSAWLPFGDCPDAGVRLLLLPHAGAGATVFKAWSSDLPAFIGACPVQPPGRERRRGEPPLTDAVAIAALLADEVLSRVRSPYAVFGHSSGAICAFEFVRQVRRLGGELPVHLFIAGRRAPQLAMVRTGIESLSLAELATVLGAFGGTPEEVLADPDLLALIQPLLAADFTVNESYSYYAEPPLDVPITAFSGSADDTGMPEQMRPWRVQTSMEFALQTLQGGHFSIFDHADSVLAGIAAKLRDGGV
jgi:medium-chain acyl-[acyl-carrier-protein] hydrolase